MWVFEENGKRHKWGNEVFDDFLQFIPKTLKCSKEDLKAWYIVEANRDAVNACEDLMSMDMATVGLEMEVWPYDAQMKFLGNKEKSK